MSVKSISTKVVSPTNIITAPQFAELCIKFANKLRGGMAIRDVICLTSKQHNLDFHIDPDLYKIAHRSLARLIQCARTATKFDFAGKPLNERPAGPHNHLVNTKIFANAKTYKVNGKSPVIWGDVNTQVRRAEEPVVTGHDLPLVKTYKSKRDWLIGSEVAVRNDEWLDIQLAKPRSVRDAEISQTIRDMETIRNQYNKIVRLENQNAELRSLGTANA